MPYKPKSLCNLHYPSSPSTYPFLHGCVSDYNYPLQRVFTMPGGLSSTLLILLFPLSSYGICYYPDGSVAPQDTPCSDTSAESTCCGQGYACLSNNICMATGDEIIKNGATLYVRGSCTDQKWRSSSCPLFCINPKEPNFDLVAGGTGISKCDKTKDDVYYCIDENTNNVDCEKLVNVLSFQG